MLMWASKALESQIKAKMAHYHCFPKNLAIYYCFGNMLRSTAFWVLDFKEIKFSMICKFYELEFYQNFFGKFESYFFKELEFLELELQGKLEFYKLKF